MSDYTKTVDFAAKDGLASGNPSKKVKGTEIDTEFNNIATHIATKPDDPTTTQGDMIYNSGASTQARLAIGTANQIVRTNSGATAPEWTDMPGWHVQTAATALTTESEIEVTTDAGYDYRIELYDIDPSTVGTGDANLEWETYESAAYVTSANEYRTHYMQVLGTTVSGNADANGNVLINTMEGSQTNAWDAWSGWIEFKHLNDANILSTVEFSLFGEASTGGHLFRHGFSRRDSAVAATKVKILVTVDEFAEGYYLVYRRRNGT